MTDLHARLILGEDAFRVDLAHGTPLAIPIGPDGRHPRFFLDDPARFSRFETDGFVGAVDAGGSCNVSAITLVPHCHGTHTECVGHITHEALDVIDVCPNGLIPATLCSVTPGAAGKETPVGPGPAITADQLDWPEWCRALVIRCLPNEREKASRHYGQSPPYPLLSVEAMDKIARAGIEHLLIDTPSIDAASDGGRLSQHRRFWQLAPGETSANPSRQHCTVTEMIFVPDHLADGPYLLSLSVSAIRGDASPSNPTLYPLQ